MRHVNWIVAVALASFGITAMAAAWPLDFWPSRFGPGEGFLPVVLGAVLAVLSLGIALQNWRKKNEGKPETESLNLTKPIRAMLIFILYLIIFDFIGFVFSTAIFLTLYIVWVEERRLRQAMTISLAVTVVTYLLFVQFLGVDLPLGVLEGVPEWIS